MATGLPGGGLAKASDALARLRGLGPVRRAAALASLVWTVLVVSYAIGFFGASQARGTVFVDGAFFLVTLALPLLLVWVAALLAEELLRQREMIAALGELVGPLAVALDGVREGLERHAPASPAEIQKAVHGAVYAAGRATDTSGALDRLVAGQGRIEAALERLRVRPAAPDAEAAAAEPVAPAPVTPAAPAAPKAQPARPTRAAVRPRVAPPTVEPTEPAEPEPGLPLLGDADPEEPLSWDDTVRAFDFPRDADDLEGFRALRLALRRRSLAQMLQAAEDVLTLLSQEGVYMDDLAVAPPDADAWRRFVAGARGAEVASVGGITDEAALTAAKALMTQDPIFRDTALFFQRRFDVALGELAPTAGDADLERLADTRSGRAFQLMARASGSFD